MTNADNEAPSGGGVRQLDDLKPAEIKAKAAELAPALRLRFKSGDLGHFEVRAVLDPVAEALGSGRRAPFVPEGSRGFAAVRLYEDRVKRALSQLAADGTLVRVAGKEEVLPDGTPNYSGSVHYYTPGAFAAATARGEQAHAERAEKSRRWADIRIRLEKGNLFMDSLHGLSLDEWELLLRRAGL